MSETTENSAFRRAVFWAGTLNLAYFGVECAVALAIGSVSLFADSIDFLEDASVNLLIMLAIGWSLRQRARLGMALAGVLFVPGLATIWMAWRKFLHPLPPSPALLSATAAGAMLVNALCALMLARHRAHGGSLAKAAYLSARNDVLANIAIILAGALTAYLWRAAWPDLLVGLGIASMNASAAREVWATAREEHGAAA